MCVQLWTKPTIVLTAAASRPPSPIKELIVPKPILNLYFVYFLYVFRDSLKHAILRGYRPFSYQFILLLLPCSHFPKVWLRLQGEPRHHESLYKSWHQYVMALRRKVS